MLVLVLFFLNDTAASVIYTDCPTLSRHDGLPICDRRPQRDRRRDRRRARLELVRDRVVGGLLERDGEDHVAAALVRLHLLEQRGFSVEHADRSEEHTSELQSLMRISYAVFCLKTNNTTKPTAIIRSHLSYL